MCESNLKSPSLYKHETLKQSANFHCQGQDDVHNSDVADPVSLSDENLKSTISECTRATASRSVCT